MEHIRDGMVLARPVYTGAGVVLLKSGTKLEASHIKRIIKLKIKHIYIEDEISNSIDINIVVRDEVVVETRALIADTIDSLSKGFDHIDKKVFESVKAILMEIIDSKEVLINLQTIRDKDDSLYSHSVNVAIISAILGKKLGYNMKQLRHLGLGALLHDVGKAFIDVKYHKYREDFTHDEFAVFRSHVKFGYAIIKDLTEGSMLSANVALSHHENYDGSGFPFNKAGKDIHEFARIVAVADEYDNCRCDFSEFSNQEIIDMVVAKSYTRLDPDIVKLFAMTIAPYPVGVGVELSNGEIGLVEKLNPSIPSRPLIRIIDKTSNTIVRRINLLEELNIVIRREVEIDSY